MQSDHIDQFSVIPNHLGKESINVDTYAGNIIVYFGSMIQSKPIRSGIIDWKCLKCLPRGLTIFILLLLKCPSWPTAKILTT